MGVRLLHRLENSLEGGFQVRDLFRSWLSINAILRLEVTGDAPVYCQLSITNQLNERN